MDSPRFWGPVDDNDKGLYYIPDMPVIDSLFTISFMVFSGIHCAAWQYNFPSLLETRLWQVSAVASGLLPLSLVIHGQGLYPLPDALPPWAHRWLALVTMAFYILARLFLLVEVFIAFRSAPAGIYNQLQWPSYFGHIGP